jgi:hypothetical protein
MKDERKIFYIKIIDRKTLLIPYILGRTITFSMFNKPIRYDLLCMIFLIFFLYIRKKINYKKVVDT